MSLTDSLAFARTQMQGAEDARLSFGSTWQRFADEAEATRGTWRDEAARSVYTRHVDPLMAALQSALRLLARAEQNRADTAVHIGQALEAADRAGTSAELAERHAWDAREVATRALGMARDARTISDDVQNRVDTIRSTLSGLVS